MYEQLELDVRSVIDKSCTTKINKRWFHMHEVKLTVAYVVYHSYN